MPESWLNYWREDPLLNEHHRHWHLVYPYAGRPDLTDPTLTPQVLKDIADGKIQARLLLWNSRHGELFAYMHAQLLARYSAERLSWDLASVVPLDDFTSAIPDGYSPGPGVMLNLDGASVSPGNRPDNAVLSDLSSPNRFSTRPGAQISAQQRFLSRLASAVTSSRAANRPFNISVLAENVEPTDRLATTYFGGVHNDGHLLISMHDNNDSRPGCLFWEEAAVRDPVFYRWHAHLDDLFRKYQDTLVPYDFSDLPPVSADRLTIIAASGRHNELLTEMRNRTLTFPDGSSMPINYLSHEDFTYLIEASNQSDSDLTVTVRIFLCPEDSVDDRRAWIEMDKFRHSLGAKATGITIHRESKASSVIRHPVLTADILEDPRLAAPSIGTSPECRCGWPYTLLLPRGKARGMPFRLLVLFTPGADITSTVVDRPNSASYCGLQDADYPDIQAMGYPFDRQFDIRIKDWISGAARPRQLASTSVNIIHR